MDKRRNVCDIYQEEQPHFSAKSVRAGSPAGQFAIHGTYSGDVGGKYVYSMR